MLILRLQIINEVKVTIIHVSRVSSYVSGAYQILLKRKSSDFNLE